MIGTIPLYASPQDKLIMHNFLGTITGRFVKVSYAVKVFVKHEAWNEFGEGNEARFPVYINQSPQAQYC
jgi:hypothetical protein